MRILVTGTLGTLGQKLVTELERRGHNVYGCDLMHSDRVKYIRADVSNHRELSHVFEESVPQAVYHLAAEFGRMNGEEYFESLWKTNCIGTQNVINNCIQYGSHLVFASSSEVYGTLSDGSDMKEELLQWKPPTFHNSYALSKWANEHQVNIAIANRGLKATILRFFNSWGSPEAYTPYRSVVALFTYRLMKGLPITVYQGYHRVFMHCSDWVVTVANVVDRLPYIGKAEVFNIGGKQFTSVETLKDLIVDVLGGTKSTITYLDKEVANIQNKRPNIDRAVLHLGHNPVITLEQGLPAYVEWMRSRHA